MKNKVIVVGSKILKFLIFAMRYHSINKSLNLLRFFVQYISLILYKIPNYSLRLGYLQLLTKAHKLMSLLCDFW